ncbi:MAG: haloacid dehalogenase type II [Bacteroidota bacterium]
MNPRPQACIFDAFGTLFQLTIPLEQIAAAAEGQGEALLDIWRQKQLEYTWLRSLMQAYRPFDKVTEEALQFGMNRLGLSNPRLFELLMPLYRQASSFPDVRPMLEQLQRVGIPTAILSNGTLEMLEAGLRHAGLAPLIGHCLSADSVRIYKPHPQVYQLATDHFDCPTEHLLFFSSNQWDIAGAGQYGFRTCWVNRAGRSSEVLPPPPAHEIGGMEQVAALLDIE